MDDSKIKIMEQGGNKVILEAMNNKSVSMVHRYGCFALLVMGWWNSDLQK